MGIKEETSDLGLVLEAEVLAHYRPGLHGDLGACLKQFEVSVVSRGEGEVEEKFEDDQPNFGREGEQSNGHCLVSIPHQIGGSRIIDGVLPCSPPSPSLSSTHHHHLPFHPPFPRPPSPPARSFKTMPGLVQSYDVLLDFTNDTHDYTSLQLLRDYNNRNGSTAGAVLIPPGETVTLVLDAGSVYKYVLKTCTKVASVTCVFPSPP